nr:Gfo/Idh/MocA family oxidoreductase [Paenibacillus bovis]
MRKVKIGFIGCGNISHIYLTSCTQKFDILDVVAVADIFPEMAQRRAEEFNIPKVYTVEELLADPEIEIVVNLTSPTVHTEVNLKILEAGKHVYTEKPFAMSREDADKVLNLAKEKGLLVGSAPDTFLGAQLQTARKLIDDGWIGKVYGAGGMFITGTAWDASHPNTPAFLDFGWDPLFDMAPYWLTAMVHLMGPATRVSGSVGNARTELEVDNMNSPFYGETLPVKAPMNVTGIIDFESGAIGHIFASKDSGGYLPRMEVYGTEGVLLIPDPNFFEGVVKVRFPNGEEKEFPYSHAHAENTRGIGVADMATALQTGRKHRASGELARHVLDISIGILESSKEGRHFDITAKCEQPAALPIGLKYNQLDK